MLIHALRLKPGQDVKKALQEFVIENKMAAAWIMTGIGSLKQTNIRYANQTQVTSENGYFEILSLSGTLSMHGSHIHICIADDQGKATGGHLMEGNIIYTTAEIVIGESKEIIFTRENDSTTGWAELSITKG